jgi:Flp pilus assembly protein TadB
MASTAATRHHSRRDDRILVDAIAVWTEQLRDMLAGSSGLEQTIASTAVHAPAVLREPLERLVASMTYSALPQALHRFAREVDHPTADFVVAALSTAATRQVRELGALLSHLASCARDEARMHTRIWVGRSRTRSAVKIIAAVVVMFVGGLALLSPDYLAPYRTAEGQVVLSVVVLVFFGALLLMQRLSVVVLPDRFVGRRSVVGA